MDLKTLTIPTRIFLGITALIVAISGIQSARDLTKLSALRRQRPFFFAGEAFAGAKDIIHGEKYAGYITDKDLKLDKNIAEFSQAQLSLAPVILDLNNPNHRFLIINCESQERAKAVLQHYRARPIRRSSLGVILAVREGL
jgi:hypothetical protein